MRTIRGIAWAAGVVVCVACGGDGPTDPPPGTGIDCVNPTTAGTAVTCSFTLTEEAEVRAVVTALATCEAEGDVFEFTAPVSATLTTDGCDATVGTTTDLSGAYPAETVVTFSFTPGTLVGGATGRGAVQYTGEYPEWTLHFEDAVGAFGPNEPDDYDDLTIKLTAAPTAN